MKNCNESLCTNGFIEREDIFGVLRSDPCPTCNAEVKVSVIDETLQVLRKARTPPHPYSDPTGKLAEAARNASIACTAVENAVLAASTGGVEWKYIEHELTTAYLRWPTIGYDGLICAVRRLFLGPREDEAG